MIHLIAARSIVKLDLISVAEGSDIWKS